LLILRSLWEKVQVCCFQNEGTGALSSYELQTEEDCGPDVLSVPLRGAGIDHMTVKEILVHVNVWKTVLHEPFSKMSPESRDRTQENLCSTAGSQRDRRGRWKYESRQCIFHSAKESRSRISCDNAGGRGAHCEFDKLNASIAQVPEMFEKKEPM
jgi:hypothetical protein